MNIFISFKKKKTDKFEAVYIIHWNYTINLMRFMLKEVKLSSNANANTYGTFSEYIIHNILCSFAFSKIYCIIDFVLRMF